MEVARKVGKPIAMGKAGMFLTSLVDRARAGHFVLNAKGSTFSFFWRGIYFRV